MASRKEKPDGAVGVSPTGHNRYIGQPHSDAEGVIAAAEHDAAQLISAENPVGPRGTPFSRRSPFFIAVLATTGVAVTWGAIQLLGAAAQILVLIGYAFFLAVGLEPAVSWLVNHRFPRALAVTTVLLAVAGVIGAFLALAVPPLVEQAQNLVVAVPDLARQIQDNSSVIGRLSEQLNLQDHVQQILSSVGPNLAGGLLGLGIAVVSGVAGLVLILVLTAYLLADLPRVRRAGYRLFPGSRRPRAILIGDQILVKVGAYVLGNLAVSVITGTVTFIWLTVFHVPYPLLLAVFVALVDLIPVVGATIGGVVVSLVALAVSVPVALATVAFHLVYQTLEGYLVVPPIMGRAVRVPALVTAIAVILGGAMLGLLGALVAIPVAAGVLLTMREVVFPALDRM